MPFEEVAGGEGGREERRMRHFGAGTATGVFRPHTGKEGWREGGREGRREQQVEAAAAMVMEEEEEVVEEVLVSEDSSPALHSTTTTNSTTISSSSSSSSPPPPPPPPPPLSHPAPIWSPLSDWSHPFHPPLLHSLTLTSAYAHRPSKYTTGEPAFTSYHGNFKGTVDYIWYNGKEGGREGGREGRLRCVEFWGMPKVGELRSQVGLPCKACPSDHLPLVVRMEWA